MSGISRRRFLGTSAALPLGVGLASGASAQGRPPTGSASMIITGGRVLTMDPYNPVVEAIAIRGDLAPEHHADPILDVLHVQVRVLLL